MKVCALPSRKGRNRQTGWEVQTGTKKVLVAITAPLPFLVFYGIMVFIGWGMMRYEGVSLAKTIILVCLGVIGVTPFAGIMANVIYEAWMGAEYRKEHDWEWD